MAGSQSNVWIGGNGATGALNKVCGGSNVGVFGAGDAIAAGAGAGVWLGGDGWNGLAETLTGSGVYATLIDDSHMDYLGDLSRNVVGDGSMFSVLGGGDAILAGAYDAIFVGRNGAGGASDAMYGDRSKIWVREKSHADIYGSNDSISLGEGSNLGVVGDGDHITSGRGANLWVSGGHNTVSGDGVSVLSDISPGRLKTSGGSFSAATVDGWRRKPSIARSSRRTPLGR